MSEQRLAESPVAGGEESHAESDAHWRPAKYFALYRLLVATAFLTAIVLGGSALNIGEQNPRLFRWVSLVYFLAAILLLGSVVRIRRAFHTQLSMQVMIDVAALTLLMHASGGGKSGIFVMLFVVLAGAGLIGQGRMTLFHASFAAVAVLVEQAYRVVHLNDDPGTFFRVGLTSIGLFATAISARMLGQRIIAQEQLARQRGVELANQLQINEAVIRDMHDGVLVVDDQGQIHQANPQALTLFQTRLELAGHLATLSPDLARHFEAWRHGGRSDATQRSPRSGKMLRTRFRKPSEGQFSLIYLEDMGEIEAQARQLKLAALGRLTANMAHEIRNPLSSISHAAELLAEDTQNVTEKRLAGIIGDNTRRINRLVAEVMELGRRDRAQAEEINLNDFVRAFIDEKMMADPSIAQRIIHSISPQWAVCFDRAHLHRVLWNLLANALRHATMAAGGIRLEVMQSDTANSVELHIIDDGPGIMPEQRSQVFEPFFTTHGSGTGLGLYIARELCEANGAQLDLLDDHGGAHFRIRFSTETCPTHAKPAAN